MTGRAAKLLPIFFILFSFAGCKPKAQMQLPPAQVPSAASAASSKIDVDLTKMKANMIYSYIFEMVVNPEEYSGKTIRVNGFFSSFFDEQTGERYFAVIIPDALACCQQGMEFKWTGDHSYPADYPQEKQQITITGTYTSTTLADDISYSYLQVSDLTF